MRKVCGIAGNIKKFNKKLYDKYDLCARNIIKNRFPDNVKDNEDIYGEDLMFHSPPIPYKYIEVQVCAKWTSDKYPFLYPFVYARKMRFSQDTLFVTFNQNLTKVIIFGRKSIDNTPTRLKKYDREMVHYVSWMRAMMLDTENFTIDTIKSYVGLNIDD